MNLFDYVLSPDLGTINRGNEPTFAIKTGQEMIDITLVNHGLTDCVQNWHVSDEI